MLEWRLKAALEKLNPDVPPLALDLAVDELTKDRSVLSPVRANQEVYKLLKDGVKVTYRPRTTTKPSRRSRSSTGNIPPTTISSSPPSSGFLASTAESGPT